jgi:hypothetical protein
MSSARSLDRLIVMISACSLIPFCVTMFDDVKDLLTREVSQRDFLGKIEAEIQNASDGEVEEWAHGFCSNKIKLADSRLEPNAPSCTDSHRDIYNFYKYRELLSQAPPGYIYPAPAIVILVSLIPAINLAGLTYIVLKAAKELLRWVANKA